MQEETLKAAGGADGLVEFEVSVSAIAKDGMTVRGALDAQLMRATGARVELDERKGERAASRALPSVDRHRGGAGPRLGTHATAGTFGLGHLVLPGTAGSAQAATTDEGDVALHDLRAGEHLADQVGDALVERKEQRPAGRGVETVEQIDAANATLAVADMEGLLVERVVARDQDGALLGDFTRIRMGQDAIRLLDRDKPAFV